MTDILKALLRLDHLLTGKDMAYLSGQQAHKGITGIFDLDGEYYLGDGGYSRLVIGVDDPCSIRLGDNSTPEVKAAFMREDAQAAKEHLLTLLDDAVQGLGTAPRSG